MRSFNCLYYISVHLYLQDVKVNKYKCTIILKCCASCIVAHLQKE
nr:MAG TPA: hypothetical protein [Caudoviricetes sp.]